MTPWAPDFTMDGDPIVRGAAAGARFTAVVGAVRCTIEIAGWELAGYSWASLDPRIEQVIDGRTRRDRVLTNQTSTAIYETQNKSVAITVTARPGAVVIIDGIGKWMVCKDGTARRIFAGQPATEPEDQGLFEWELS